MDGMLLADTGINFGNKGMGAGCGPRDGSRGMGVGSKRARCADEGPWGTLGGAGVSRDGAWVAFGRSLRCFELGTTLSALICRASDKTMKIAQDDATNWVPGYNLFGYWFSGGLLCSLTNPSKVGFSDVPKGR